MFQAARRVALILILAMGVTAPALAQSGPGQGDFERGEALLAKGEFQQALEAYQAAAKAAPDNPAYGQRVAVVQQVLRIEGIAADASHAQWAQAVQMLHGFYLSNGLAERALPNDRKLHEREGSNATGYALATTLADLKRTPRRRTCSARCSPRVRTRGCGSCARSCGRGRRSPTRRAPTWTRRPAS